MLLTLNRDRPGRPGRGRRMARPARPERRRLGPRHAHPAQPDIAPGPGAAPGGTRHGSLPPSDPAPGRDGVAV